MSTSNSTANCPHCGLVHLTTCPRIKVIECYADGTIKRVEFHPYVMAEFLDRRPNWERQKQDRKPFGFGEQNFPNKRWGE